MVYSVRGTVAGRGNGFFVLEAAGIGFRVHAGDRTLSRIPGQGELATVFCHLKPREDALELYGFLSEEELRFFELLLTVSGVGPRSALAILDVADLRQLAAAIKEGRPDMMTRASGIGRKTAERIVVDLKGKIAAVDSAETVAQMEGDADIMEMLVGLGYRREEARGALARVDGTTEGLEARLKAALRILGRT